MKMKKAKLFMMLALLVMGVSNVWAVDSEGNYHYRVFFESGVIKGGYRVTNTNVIKTPDDAVELISTQRISRNNYSNYISLRQVTGNNEAFYINESDTGSSQIVYLIVNVLPLVILVVVSYILFNLTL